METNPKPKAEVLPGQIKLDEDIDGIFISKERAIMSASYIQAKYWREVRELETTLGKRWCIVAKRDQLRLF